MYRLTSIMAALLALMACGEKASGPVGYALDPDWPLVPQGIDMGEVSGVAVDSEGYLFAFHRAGRTMDEAALEAGPIAADTILKLDPESGQVLARFGAGLFVMPYGLSIDRDDNLWATDSVAHQVIKLSPEGQVLLTIGEYGVAGQDESHFDGPTDVAFLSSSEVLVADGYGNSRVAHMFANGTFREEWGSAGNDKGEFHIVHSVAVNNDDRIYVADRDNERVQLFDQYGNFLGAIDELVAGRPYGVEVGSENTLYIVSTYGPEEGGTRMIKMTSEGAVLADVEVPQDTLQHVFGHDIAVAPNGDVFIGNIRSPGIFKISLQELVTKPVMIEEQVFEAVEDDNLIILDQ
ncbi:MAG: peptidyl-alpha-hydroxyglycine alpha-amidating lyase family protein [Pseudomonadota bacterium]